LKGVITTGVAVDFYFPISSIPRALHGWCISYVGSVSTQLNITSVVTINGTPAYSASGQVLTNSSVYKEFVVQYYGLPAAGVDSAMIQLGVGVSTTPDSTAYFIVDDLSLQAPSTSISEPATQPLLEACSPNPTTGIANIIYSLPAESTVSLNLYDMLGHQVAALLPQTAQSEGRYKVHADLVALPAGVYIYQLTVDGQVYCQRIAVAR
jgi:hypothetical protein